MPCGWEGNRRSGVALAMRHRLQWFIQLRAHGLDREMSTPPTLCCGVRPICLTAVLCAARRGSTWTRGVANWPWTATWVVKPLKCGSRLSLLSTTRPRQLPPVCHAHYAECDFVCDDLSELTVKNWNFINPRCRMVAIFARCPPNLT